MERLLKNYQDKSTVSLTFCTLKSAFYSSKMSGLIVAGALCFCILTFFPNEASTHLCSRPAYGPGTYVENSLGEGCVALVRGKCSGANKQTTTWTRGIKVRENCNSIPALTAIATFRGPGNTYNGGDFKHAAIYAGTCDSEGIDVYDQYANTNNGVVTKIGVNYRKLKYSASQSNNGDYMYVIL